MPIREFIDKFGGPVRGVIRENPIGFMWRSVPDGLSLGVHKGSRKNR